MENKHSYVQYSQGNATMILDESAFVSEFSRLRLFVCLCVCIQTNMKPLQ